MGDSQPTRTHSRARLLVVALALVGIGGGVAVRLANVGGAASTAPTSGPAGSPTTGMPAPSVAVGATATPAALAPSASPSAAPSPTLVPGPPVDRGPARLASHGPRSTHAIALTFDDGWSTAACRSVVGILLAEHVTATFFPNAMYVRASPSFWHWVAAAGFPVGSHTTTHVSATRLAPAILVADLQTSRRIDDSILGVPSIPVLRPPFGNTNAAVLKSAGAAGFPLVVNWDVDSRDWAGGSLASVLSNTTRGTNGSVVLMHCGPATTPRILPAVIAWYRARGYSFVTVPTMFGLQPQAAPASPKPLAAADAPPLLANAAAASAAGTQAGGPEWGVSIAARAGGGLAAAWEAPDGIWFTPDTAASAPPELVAATTDASFAMHPSLAIGPDGVAHVVYLVASAGGIDAVHRARDAGGQWQSPGIVADVGAPTPTPSVAIAPDGAVWVAYGVVLHGSPNGIWLAKQTATGWTRTALRSTNGSHLDPALAFTRDGVAHVFTRRNGYSEVDETTWTGKGTSHTVKTVAATMSAESYTVTDASGRLWLAYQPSADSRVRLGFRSKSGWTWMHGEVADEAILSGLASVPGGVCVAFERTDAAGISRALTTCRTPTGKPLP